MGYPMSFARFIHRNGLGDYQVGYDHNGEHPGQGSAIKGDLLRFVEDTQDHAHVEWLARDSGATEDQVRRLLARVFADEHRIAVTDVPFGGPDLTSDQLLSGDVLPTGAELTKRADRVRVEFLETSLRQMTEQHIEAICALCKRLPKET